MRKNGLVVNLYIVFVKDRIHQEKVITNGKNTYKEKSISFIKYFSKRPHNIKYKKITSKVEETKFDKIN